jgi:hypothetical protein
VLIDEGAVREQRNEAIYFVHVTMILDLTQLYHLFTLLYHCNIVTIRSTLLRYKACNLIRSTRYKTYLTLAIIVHTDEDQLQNPENDIETA